jgi:2,5-diamino-6-(ribosylamino)-4(3H)-pyrimidinone 5'-phosphate reductase
MRMRPRVVVNCAMSADGKIALSSRRQTRISSDADMARVHRLRNGCDAILVGVETVLCDDPGLLVKAKLVKKVRQPLRVILDSRGRTPPNAKAVSPDGRTLIAVAGNSSTNRWGPNVEVVPAGPGPKVSIPVLLEELGRRGIRSVLVEGGGETIWSFLRAGVVDRLTIYVGSLALGGNGPTPCGGEGVRSLEEAVRLRLASARKLGGGILLVYEPMR